MMLFDSLSAQQNGRVWFARMRHSVNSKTWNPVLLNEKK